MDSDEDRRTVDLDAGGAGGCAADGVPSHHVPIAGILDQDGRVRCAARRSPEEGVVEDLGPRVLVVAGGRSGPGRGLAPAGATVGTPTSRIEDQHSQVTRPVAQEDVRLESAVGARREPGERIPAPNEAVPPHHEPAVPPCICVIARARAEEPARAGWITFRRRIEEEVVLHQEADLLPGNLAGRALAESATVRSRDPVPDDPAAVGIHVVDGHSRRRSPGGGGDGHDVERMLENTRTSDPFEGVLLDPERIPADHDSRPKVGEPISDNRDVPVEPRVSWLGRVSRALDEDADAVPVPQLHVANRHVMDPLVRKKGALSGPQSVKFEVHPPVTPVIVAVLHQGEDPAGSLGNSGSRLPPPGRSVVSPGTDRPRGDGSARHRTFVGVQRGMDSLPVRVQAAAQVRDVFPSGVRDAPCPPAAEGDGVSTWHRVERLPRRLEGPAGLPRTPTAGAVPAGLAARFRTRTAIAEVVHGARAIGARAATRAGSEGFGLAGQCGGRNGSRRQSGRSRPDGGGPERSREDDRCSHAMGLLARRAESPS